MNATLAEIQAMAETLTPDEKERLVAFLVSGKKIESASNFVPAGGHSIMDIPRVSLGKMLRPLGTRDEWFDEMGEGRI